MVAFLARTPLKLAAIDRRRGRSLPRTRLARRVAAGELALLAVLAAGAVVLAEPGFWIPGAVALPLLAVEAWFEVRSRGRRLVPELAGAVGVSSVAAMVLLAGGQDGRLALAAWAVLAARSCTSIPHVRLQIARLHGRPPEAHAATAGNAVAIVLAASAFVLDAALVAGTLAVGLIVVVQQLALRRPVPRPVVLGTRQMAMGLGLVLVTAVGAIVAIP